MRHQIEATDFRTVLIDMKRRAAAMYLLLAAEKYHEGFMANDSNKKWLFPIVFVWVCTPNYIGRDRASKEKKTGHALNVTIGRYPSGFT